MLQNAILFKSVKLSARVLNKGQFYFLRIYFINKFSRCRHFYWEQKGISSNYIFLVKIRNVEAEARGASEGEAFLVYLEAEASKTEARKCLLLQKVFESFIFQLEKYLKQRMGTRGPRPKGGPLSVRIFDFICWYIRPNFEKFPDKH